MGSRRFFIHSLQAFCVIFATLSGAAGAFAYQKLACDVTRLEGEVLATEVGAKAQGLLSDDASQGYLTIAESKEAEVTKGRGLFLFPGRQNPSAKWIRYKDDYSDGTLNFVVAMPRERGPEFPLIIESRYEENDKAGLMQLRCRSEKWEVDAPFRLEGSPIARVTVKITDEPPSTLRRAKVLSLEKTEVNPLWEFLRPGAQQKFYEQVSQAFTPQTETFVSIEVLVPEAARKKGEERLKALPRGTTLSVPVMGFVREPPKSLHIDVQSWQIQR